MTVRTIQAELMLLSWAETSNGGAKVVFQLADTADLEPFKSLTLAKGKQAGQRFMAVLALIEDDAPERKSAIGPLCQLAVRWCADETFRTWLAKEYAPELGLPGRPPVKVPLSVDDAAACVRALSGVKSRRDIDGDVNFAEANFNSTIRFPYMAFLRAINGE